jgi:4,5-DOPA dioxygenase extradiol
MERVEFLKLLTLIPFLKKAKGLELLLQQPGLLSPTARMPVFFTGHLDSEKKSMVPFFNALKSMGKSVKPSVILVVSAHWLTAGESYVSINERYAVAEYISYGSPPTAKLLSEHTDIKTAYWELDHGAWMVLKHIAPDRNIPVLQLSIDMDQPLDYHYRLARQLAPLRDKGVLIIGSGNIVHNLELSMVKFWSNKPYQWALDFDYWVKDKIDNRDLLSLFQYYKMAKLAKLAVPTADHYIPLLYVISLADQKEAITHIHEEVIKGLSMRCIRVG